jgi:PAS domain S-box-containing protein
MDDVMSVQLAISKLHMQSLISQGPTDTVAKEALAELSTALAELEATNDELQRSNDTLAHITQARDLEARRYRELFEQIPVACLVTDNWGVIDVANQAAQELLNVPRSLLIGKPVSVFVMPAERREFRDRLNRIPLSEVWEVVFQARGREPLAVQLDVTVIPSPGDTERRLCWVIQNNTPQRTAATTEKLLARESTLRMEAQATVTRLRALHVGLEQMAHDEHIAIPKRVIGLIEALVPRFAQQISCQFPGTPEPAIELGVGTSTAHVIEAPIYGPDRTPGRLIARRPSAFMPEDSANLMSAANAITALICRSGKTAQQ